MVWKDGIAGMRKKEHDPLSRPAKQGRRVEESQEPRTRTRTRRDGLDHIQLNTTWILDHGGKSDAMARNLLAQAGPSEKQAI